MKNRKTKSFVARREVAHQPPLKPLLASRVETKPQRLIVVLGMHRSGTSAMTRGLQVMGVDLGDRMMPPVAGNNAKGFWEDIDLNALNIEMLQAFTLSVWREVPSSLFWNGWLPLVTCFNALSRCFSLSNHG